MLTLRHCLGLGFLVLLFGWICSPTASAEANNFAWTVLTPEHDSRDAETRDYDEFISRSLVGGMNATEPIFRHRLLWNKLPIKNLLAVYTPFCELHFDAVKPLILTDDEKSILKEYLARGGFILLVEDLYPYFQDELWSVMSWPLMDYVTKALPAADAGFEVERVIEPHPLFRQYYRTSPDQAIRHELEGNPFTPSHLLLSYHHHPSAFVIGSYFFVLNDKWIAMPRPFQHVFRLTRKSYEFNVNIYLYVVTH